LFTYHLQNWSWWSFWS